MKSCINDSRIKGLIREYRDGDGYAYKKLVEMVSSYIYNYPRIVFGADEDRCGDYYEYVLVRLRGIIDRFRDTGVRFTSWFTVVLRTRYFNYIRESRKGYILREGVSRLSLDFESDRYSGLHNLIGDGRDYSCSESGRYEEIVDMIVRELNDRQRVFFHLYYLDTLRPEDVGFLSIYLGNTPRETLEGIDRVRSTMVRRYEQRHRLLIKLNEVYRRIVYLQQEQDAGMVRAEKNRQKRLLYEYGHIRLNPSYKSIAEFLNLPVGTVSSRILRMKACVRRIVEWEAGGAPHARGRGI
ncbi:MAG: sigma-70 family RNA polymerase sigma factor [Spirochaetes bacterium]|nr:sigma-70 family RNA polymerase sigma factor [Spirochaetota bacterium]